MSMFDIDIFYIHTNGILLISLGERKMSTNISLTPELEQYAKSQVSSGLYNSVSELMREAVRLLREKNTEQAIYLDAMHTELNTASIEIDNEEITPLDLHQLTDDVFNDLSNKHA